MNTILSVTRLLAFLALLSAVLIAACGGGEGEGPAPETQVREALMAYVTSIKDKDAERLCGLIDPEQLEGLAGSGLPCEVAMSRQFFESVEAPQLAVGAIEVDGDVATAEVKTSAPGQPPLETTITLRRIEGDWKVSVSEDADPAPSAPSPPPERTPRSTPEGTPPPASG